MSLFGNSLNDVLRRTGITQHEASEHLGVSPSAISQYIHQDIRPGREALASIMRLKIPIADRLEIVIAHLRDEIPDLARRHITIERTNPRLKEQEPSFLTQLPADVIKDLECIARTANGARMIRFIRETIAVLHPKE